jgi:uncharacterized membrane protein YgdD (TMEM256/DUF423 family)
MNKTILVTASILGILSVILGAFAAHGLKALITVEQLQSFETGVRYQMYHVFLLLFIGSIDKLTMQTKKTVFYLVISGVLLFSGSIYGLATNALSGFDFKQIALITPIGGLLLIVAWIVMGIGFVRNTDN